MKLKEFLKIDNKGKLKMKKYVLKIEGMKCEGCKNRLENYLNNQDGIIKATVSLEKNEAYIECKENISTNDLKKFVSEVEFSCTSILDN